MNVYWEHNLRFFTGKFHLYLFKLQGTSYGTGSDFIKDKHVGKVGFRTTAGMVHTFNRRLDVVTGLSYEIKGLKFKAYSENPDYNPPAMKKVVQDLTRARAQPARGLALPKRLREGDAGGHSNQELEVDLH